jgi:hypothetical protein
MIAPSSYDELIGSNDPLILLATTPKKIAELVKGWDANRWARSYAPGKWTAAQLVLHLAQDEIGLSARVRLALSDDDYVVQPFDGARWVAAESPSDPETALAAFLALRNLNLVLYKRIPAVRRARPIPHPELGAISIDWILRTLAGHDLHHLRHFQMIAKEDS